MHQNPTFARWLVLLRALVPFGTLVAAVALTGVPYGIPFLGPVTPFFALIAIYYWSIHRPEAVPAIAIFAVGVLQDLITGGPPGSVSLLLLLVHALTVSQQRILLGQSYLVEWAGFALVAVGTALVSWLLACVYNTVLIVPWHFLVQALLTVALYPAAATVLTPAAKWSRAAEPA
jgi:rod shape-determining protein MreD